MSDMVKHRAVSFKKDHIGALYFTMSDIVHSEFTGQKIGKFTHLEKLENHSNKILCLFPASNEAWRDSQSFFGCYCYPFLAFLTENLFISNIQCSLP
jgi:hypothetical protein